MGFIRDETDSTDRTAKSIDARIWMSQQIDSEASEWIERREEKYGLLSTEAEYRFVASNYHEYLQHTARVTRLLLTHCSTN